MIIYKKYYQIILPIFILLSVLIFVVSYFQCKSQYYFALNIISIIFILIILQIANHLLIRKEFIIPEKRLISHIGNISENINAPIPEIPKSWHPMFELVSKTFKENYMYYNELERVNYAMNEAYEILNKYNETLEEKIAERTHDLREKNEKLSQEIFERKKAEEVLKLSARVFEYATEGIIVTDSKANIQSVNPAFCEITQYKAEEIIGKNPRILKSGRHEAEFFSDMWKSLAKKGKWQGEIWNRRKNGEIFPEWLSIAAIYNDKNEIIQYAGIFTDITGRKKYEELMKFQAYHDPLTGLPNRSLFLDLLSLELNHAKRDNKMLAILFLDLDGFKQVNDNLGHSTGDKLLQRVAEILKGCIRQSDTLARLGGDEFIIIIPNIRNEKDVKKITEKILLEFRKPLLKETENYPVTTSIGVSIYPKDDENSDNLIDKADKAMYKAKKSGKDNYKFYNE